MASCNDGTYFSSTALIFKICGEFFFLSMIAYPKNTYFSSINSSIGGKKKPEIRHLKYVRNIESECRTKSAVCGVICNNCLLITALWSQKMRKTSNKKVMVKAHRDMWWSRDIGRFCRGFTIELNWHTLNVNL